MTWFLDLRALPVGGEPATEATARQGADPVAMASLAAAAQGRHLLFATHGFNVDRQAGIDSLTGWETWLTLPPGALFVGVLWPGDARWLPGLDYPIEDGCATACGQLLARCIDANFTASAASLSFVSHSLGARVVLEAIAAMTAPVRRLALMAGAIDDDCLTSQYQGLLDRIDGISVLASTSDAVLAVAFPIGNVFAGLLDQGHPYGRAALGRSGPQVTPPGKLQGHWQIPDSWDYGHFDYLATAATPGGGRFTLPVFVPPGETPAPDHPEPWRPAWSAGLVASRFL
jgi:Alpha/beta hydrolase of unknown function (DUF900)